MKKVALLFDLSSPPPADQDYRQYDKQTEWDNEIDVKRALQRIGYEVVLIGVHDDLSRLIKDLDEIKPDIIFNMTESFRNHRDFEPQVAGVLDLLQIPYTGTKYLGLGICQDKSLSKKILTYHRIRTPKWTTSHAKRPIRGLKNFSYPAFIKPAREEGSEGISKSSFAENEKDCIERVHFLHEKYQSDVIIEEFIEGRELYVSVLGRYHLQVFPFRELTFSDFPEGEPQFATYRTKWNEAYRKKWGIRNQFAKELSDKTIEQTTKIVKKAFKALHLSSYARFDLRLSTKGEVVLLEANPNPSLADYDDFAMSAKKGGTSYDDMIKKIIEMAT